MEERALKIEDYAKSSGITDEEARQVFYDAMKIKANDIGMKGTTTFSNACGHNDRPYNRTTIQDLVKLVIYASDIDKLYPIWNTPYYKLKDRKGTASYDLLSTYTNPEYTAQILSFNPYYYILGGKTGTTSIYNLACVVEDIETGVKFVGAVSGGEANSLANPEDPEVYDTNENNRFTNSKTLYDIAKRLYKDRNADISDLEAKLQYQRACVCILPEHGSAYNRYDFFGKKNPYFLYSKNATEEMPFASTQKIMTACTAFDYIDDLSETLTIKESDYSHGSGPKLVAGEVYTIRDALYAMFLPSSNTMCQAVARVVGHKILKINTNK